MVGRTRLIAVVVVLVAGGITAALVSNNSPSTPKAQPSASQPSETESKRAGCIQFPARASRPSWFPQDLPLPEGSYPTSQVTNATQSDGVVYVVNASLDEFVLFAAKQWPASGWTVTGGERESDEAEAPFHASDGQTTGRFRARRVYCETDKTEVLLVINK